MNKKITEKNTRNKCNIDWISLTIKLPEIYIDDEQIRIKKRGLSIEEINSFLATNYTEMNNEYVRQYILAEYLKYSCEHYVTMFSKFMNDKELSLENFIYNNKKAMASFYNASYNLNSGQSGINFSFNKFRLDMGINFMITGSGCKLVKFNEFRAFINNLTELGVEYKCNRLDIAYDDFDKIIPVDMMIESTEKTLESYAKKEGKLYYKSRIRKNLTSIVTNYFDGQLTKNLLFGKHSSVKSFRLYDKRAEQKISEIDYWYRLEIELHSNSKDEVADVCFHQFIDKGNILEVYLEQLQSMITFFENGYSFNKKSFEFNSTSGTHSECKVSEQWLEFMSFLNNSLRIICIMRSKI